MNMQFLLTYKISQDHLELFYLMQLAENCYSVIDRNIPMLIISSNTRPNKCTNIKINGTLPDGRISDDKIF